MMRGTRAASLGIAAVVAMLVFGASSAFATENLPHFGKCFAKTGGLYANSGCTKLANGVVEKEKFEWEPIGEKTVKFTSAKEKETGNAVLEGANGTEISCSGQTEKVGEYGPGDQVKNVIGEFSGCKALGSGCNSNGQAVEHINTLKLHGEPGIVKKELKEEKNIDGSDLRGEANEFLAEFSCGPAPVIVRGGVVVKAQQDSTGGTSGEVTNKMNSTIEVEFVAEKGGIQVPSEWTPNGGGISNSKHEKIKEVLEGNVNNAGFERSGQSLTTVQKGATKLELRQCEKTIVCSN